MNYFRNRLLILIVILLLVPACAGTILAQTNEEKTASANQLFNEAVDLFQQNTAESYRVALDRFRQANRLYKEIGYKGENAGISLLVQGSISDHLGEKQAALKFYDQALLFFRENNYKRWEAGTLTNIGSVYSALGAKQKALDYYNQALAIFRQIGNRSGEAVTLANIGLIYDDLGEKQKALNYYNQALPLSKQVGNKSGEAATLHNIGRLYDALGEKQKAIDYYNQSLPLYRQIGNRSGEAVTLNNIGGIYDDLGEKQKAIDYFNQALSLHRAVGNKSGEAVTLHNIGRFYDDLGEKQKAIDYYNESLPLRRSVGDKSGEAVTLSNIGTIYYTLGKKQKALEYFQASLPLSKYVGDKSNQSITLNLLMSYWKSLSNPRLAVFYGKQSVNLLQELRSDIQGLDKNFQQTYLKSIEDTYRRLADILIAEGRIAEALQVLNLFKDQQFFDFNQNQNQPLKQLVKTPREAALSLRFEKSLDSISQAWQAVDDLRKTFDNRSLNSQETAQLQKLENDLKTANDDFSALLKQSVSEFSKPVEADDKVSAVPDLTEMQKSLRDLNQKTGSQTVAVYTLVGEDNFRALIISQDDIKAVSSPIKGADLNDLALHYWKLLQSDKYEPAVIARQVYDRVFKPLEAELPPNTKTIMWSLDGNLRYLPMAALFDGKQYLVERYSHVNFTRADAERMTRNLQPNWTGAGFGSSDAHTVELLGDKISFGALPGVNRELARIFKQTNSPSGILNGSVLADRQFTRQTFFDSLKTNRPVVHIASHFAFRPGDESRSFLLLGDGSALTLDEMKRQTDLFKGVDLLTLSACETAATRADANGREVDGFAELAQRLGAGAVMASLWQVADESTAQLMSEFYRLKTNNPQISKAEAMREVQISMLRGEQRVKRTKERRSDLAGSTIGDGEGFAPFTKDENKPFAHPFYWSPFVLIGNWR